MDRQHFVDTARDRLRDRRYSANTIKAYLFWVNQLGDFYPIDEIDKLSSSQIEAFLQFLSKHRRLADATVRQASQALTSVFKAAVSRDLDIKLLNWRKGDVPDIFDPDELIALFESTVKDDYKILFKIIYGAGLSLSEALRLRVEDVDVDNHILYVGRRGGAKIACAIPFSASEEFKQLLSRREPLDWVWKGRGSEGKNALSSSAVQKAFKRALRMSGNSKRLTVRSLRHSYVKHLEMNGVPIHEIAGELGLTPRYLAEKMGEVGTSKNNVRISPLDIIYDTTTDLSAAQDADTFWYSIHSDVVRVAKSRFNSGHLADSVEAALKLIEVRVRGLVQGSIAEKLSGSKLMQRALSLNEPLLQLSDLTTESGRNVQVGYMQIFAGVMTGIRNPKAHDNIQIDEEEAIHLLYLSSLLMRKLDKVPDVDVSESIK